MDQRDKQSNIEKIEILAPSEVEGDICLSRDLQSITSTSLGGKISPTDRDLLKKILKDLAFKVIKETYEEYKQNSSNLH